MLAHLRPMCRIALVVRSCAVTAVITALVHGAFPLSLGKFGRRLPRSFRFAAFLSLLFGPYILEDLLLLLFMLLVTLTVLVLDAALNTSLNTAQQLILPGIDKRHGLAFLSGTASTANAVDIAFGIVRNIIIEYMCHALNIKPPGSNIRCTEDL